MEVIAASKELEVIELSANERFRDSNSKSFRLKTITSNHFVFKASSVVFNSDGKKIILAEYIVLRHIEHKAKLDKPFK